MLEDYNLPLQMASFQMQKYSFKEGIWKFW